MTTISPGSTSRTTLAPMVASAASSLATTQPRSSRPRTSGRMPCGSRAAYRVSSFIQTNENAPRSCGSTSIERCSSEVSGWWASSAVTRPVSLVDDSRARAWRSSSPDGPGRSATSLDSSCGVDQVAVVAERDRAVGGGAERRLRVLPGAGAGRGVARVADGQVALERVEGGLVEHLRDQAHVLVDQDLPPVADRDAGGLLAAVLQGVEPEIGQLGDVLAGRPDPEDATGVLRALVLGVECCGQPAVAAGAGPGGEGHVSESTGGTDTRPGIVAARVFEYLGEIWPLRLTSWPDGRWPRSTTRCLGTRSRAASTKRSRRPGPRPFFATRSQLIAEGVTELAGLRRRRDQRRPRRRQARGVAVAGNDQARQELKGTRTPVKTLRKSSRRPTSWGLMQFVPHERLTTRGLATWAGCPTSSPIDVPDAWHPLDLLIAPLYSARGELLRHARHRPPARRPPARTRAAPDAGEVRRAGRPRRRHRPRAGAARRAGAPGRRPPARSCAAPAPS